MAWTDADGLGKTTVGQDLHAQLELEVRDDREEVGVARALAVSVGRALHVRRAGLDRREGVGDRAAGVVLAVDADPYAAARDYVATTRVTPATGACPPLVSQSTPTSAPASDAAWSKATP